MIKIFTKGVSYISNNTKDRDLATLQDEVNRFTSQPSIIRDKVEFETYTLEDLIGISSGANVNNVAANTGTFNDTANVFDDILINAVIRITSGTGVNQRRRIQAIGSPTQLIVTPTWATIPDNSSNYSIDRGTWFTVIVDYNVKQT